MKRTPAAALAVALALTVPCLASEEAVVADLPAAEVLERALETARRAEESGYESRFRLRLRRVTEQLDGDESVTAREETLFEVFPVQGRWFERLVQRDGRLLDAREQAREAERERRFASRLREGKPPDRKKQQVRFDEHLVGKYAWEVLTPEVLEGRAAYVLGFRPASRDLPVRDRMDYALNKAEGRLWIDAETFELARVRFELKERVKLWWGILGSLSRVDGSFERRPAAGGVWLPREFRIHMNGRILFSSLHRRQSVTWSDVRAVGDAGDEAN